MRLERLSVESFAGIDKADITFGPGLNVLYGPNDLGKSRLAKAIRAGLLLPAAAAEGRRLMTWQSEASAHVAIVLVGQDGKRWRVSKVFGGEAAGTAELASSKDGASYHREAQGREVDEKIRKMLCWGIPSPGGKGAPRGLPDSFLTHVLLAEQTQVDTIFKKSLREDADPAGQVELRRVLQVLAHDPTLKRVLDDAQKHVDQFFTEKGGLKRGKGARLVTIRDEITALEVELEAVRKRCDESAFVQNQFEEARRQHDTVLQKLAEADTALAETRARREHSRAYEAGSADRDAAKRALDEIDAHVQGVNEKERELATLDAAAKDAASEAERARAVLQSAMGEAQAAEEALRRAQSEDGAAQREARRVEFQTLLTKAEARAAAAASLLQTATHAAAAEKQLRDALEEQNRLSLEVPRSTQLLEESKAKAAELDGEIKLLGAVVAYGHWRAATAAMADVQRIEGEVNDLRSQAETAEAEAAAEARGSQASLPTPSEIDALDELDKARALAEARLDGMGLSVRLRARRDLRLVAQCDGEETTRTATSGSVINLDATRTLAIGIDEIVDLEIATGSADGREAINTARAAWAARGEPALKLAAVDSVAALRSARKAFDDAAANQLRLRQVAQTCREKAALHSERIERLRQSGAKAASFEEAFSRIDRTTLEQQFARLGDAWETTTNSELKARSGRLEELARTVASLERSIAVQASRLEQQTSLVAERELAVATSLGQLDESSETALARARAESDAAREEQTRLLAALAAIETEGSQTLLASERGLNEARALVAHRQKDADEKQEAVKLAEHMHAVALGALGELRAAAERLDRPAAVARLKSCEERLAELPRLERLATDDDVAHAATFHEEARAAADASAKELAKAEGAVQSTGGHALSEQLEEINAALASRREMQRDVESEAYAWRLLTETLKEVQAEQDVHIGKELSAPVSARLGELTSDRYAIDLGPNLEPHRIQGMSGGDIEDMLAAFSVGTREQLATLLRITLAEYLKCCVVLDDHLVQTDPVRLEWFRKLLRRAASSTQVIVVTCRPEDYLAPTELADGEPTKDIAGGLVRAIDLGRLVERKTTFRATSHGTQPNPSAV